MIADVGDVEVAHLIAEHGVEDHMLHHVSQLLHDLCLVATGQCVGQFIDFLDRIGPQTLEGLLPVPGTILPQAILHVYQPLEGAKPLGAPVVFFLFYHNGKGTKFSFLGKKNRPIPAFIGKLMQIMASKAGDLGKNATFAVYEH